MNIRQYISIMVLTAICTIAEAQTITIEKILLNDIDNGGPWPCLYYELNKNEDLSKAVSAMWYSASEDETYWQTGVGPFSNDPNKFFITDWASELHPLLVRRHFTLTEEDIQNMASAIVTLRSSYDEDPVFYLNGTRLITYSGWNDNNYATFTFNNARKKLFVEGDNILAISVKQGGGGGHLDCSLTMKYNETVGIDETNATPESTHTTYTIDGKKIDGSSLARGIYIIDGEKVVIP